VQLLSQWKTRACTGADWRGGNVHHGIEQLMPRRPLVREMRANGNPRVTVQGGWGRRGLLFDTVLLLQHPHTTPPSAVSAR